MTPQLGDLGGKKGASRCRGIAFGLQGGDRLRGLCCEILAAGLDRGDRSRLEIIDPGAGRIQPLAFLPPCAMAIASAFLALSRAPVASRICWSRINSAF
jgi:hypothetical protein